MKKLMLIILLGLLPWTASAQSEQQLDEVRISAPAILLELPAQRRNVWYDEFDQVKGTYYLSNGPTMQLSLWGNRMYAKVDGKPRSQLIAESPYVFVALDQKLRITMKDLERDSELIAEVLMVVPALNAGIPQEQLTRLVARR